MVHKLKRIFLRVIPIVIYIMILTVSQVFAVDDMWTVANRIIIDVYNKIAGISTVLAGLMTTVCVVGRRRYTVRFEYRFICKNIRNCPL